MYENVGKKVLLCSTVRKIVLHTLEAFILGGRLYAVVGCLYSYVSKYMFIYLVQALLSFGLCQLIKTN